MEGVLLLDGLLDRVASVEEVGEVVRTANPLLRGIRHLPVRVEPR